ncbi:MAG: polysaccharide pyruvyl transferase family protein [Rikenellaceae bacterium]
MNHTRKTIAIMTYWCSNENYGQILQMYALYNSLKTLGHNVFIVRYDGINDSSLTASMCERLIRVAINPARIANILKSAPKKESVSNSITTKTDCQFERFKSENFAWSNLYKSYSQLKSNPPEADVYICGSDIVWVEGPKYKPYFLEFVSSATKIAYAPSFGSSSISREFKFNIKRALKSFSAISTREQSGVKICNSMGFDNAQWMPDPTLLLSKEQYGKIASEPKSTNKYIFLYLLGSDTTLPFEQIEEFKSAKNLDLEYCALSGRKDKNATAHPTIEEWLGYIKHSEYVITNSFHGCVFAIIFNKPFMFLPLTGKDAKKNERIISFLDKLEIKNRIFNNKISDIDTPLEYTNINNKIQKWIDQANQFIVDAINLR